MIPLTDTSAWRALQKHARDIRDLNVNHLFAADEGRAQTMAAEAAGIYLDYSKQRITRQTLDLLQNYAIQQDLSGWIQRLFAGESINATENRAAMHMALRAPRTQKMLVHGEDVVAPVHAVLDRMYAFAHAVRSGAWRGATGAVITDVVNIGIGGSDLGPRMVVEALAPHVDGPRMHYIANVDASQIHRVLAAVAPESTLFIITSKTFTTQETMANAELARNWLVSALGSAAVAQHFVAVSTNAPLVEAFGIHPNHVFGFWDWVGGRYSMWGAVGLSVVVAIGPERFAEFLRGAAAIDHHVQVAPIEHNLPVLMALLCFWNTNFAGCADHVIAPYAQRLNMFVDWLQQLEMESNGKSVNRQGQSVNYATTPALWGDVGTNGQHAFFQMLHQGSAVHPVDFILVCQADHPYAEMNRLLLANGLAQSAALMRGKSAPEVAFELSAKGLTSAALESAVPPRVFSGNRPSNTLVLPRIDASHLGALCALYEHRTFVLSVLWDINPFDQWGVELGKQLAQQVLKALDGQHSDLDASTKTLLQKTGLLP